MSLPVSAELRAEMGRQKISGPELAEKSGVGNMTIYRKVQREERSLTIDEAMKASLALGLPLSEIITRAENAREKGATSETSDAR